MKSTPSNETRRRVLDAAIAAERDSSPDLTVELMAEFVGLSLKHFQRAFLAVLGETPKEYLRRVRLQRAAYLLKWSDLLVIDIAIESGFHTHAGFTHAFAKAYGCSPLVFRQEEGIAPFLRRRTHVPGPNGLQSGNFDTSRLVVRVQKLDAVRVAAMRHIGSVESCARVWVAMRTWAREVGLANRNTEYLGIHNDYWDPLAEDKYRYDAAVVIPPGFEHRLVNDNRVNFFTIPGGAVAKTEFAGSLAEADATWRRFVDQWLPISGYRPRTAYAYDTYPPSLIQAGALQRILQAFTGIRATLCLPIE